MLESVRFSGMSHVTTVYRWTHEEDGILPCQVPLGSEEQKTFFRNLQQLLTWQNKAPLRDEFLSALDPQTPSPASCVIRVHETDQFFILTGNIARAFFEKYGHIVKHNPKTVPALPKNLFTQWVQEAQKLKERFAETILSTSETDPSVIHPQSRTIETPMAWLSA